MDYSAIVNSLNLQLVVILLVFTRIISLFFFMPIFGHTSIPATVRIFLSILMVIVLYPVIPVPDDISGYISLWAILVATLKEFSLGFCLGLAATIIISIIQFASGVMGHNMGLREGNLIDPLFDGSTDALTQYMFIVFMLLFLIFNGHHFIIKFIAASFDIVPLGSVPINGAVIEKLVDLIGCIFVLGLKFSGPVMAFLIITSFAFGIIGRAVPDMNLLIMLLPVKIFVGLMGVVVMFPLLLYFVQVLLRMFYRDLTALLHIL